MVNSEAWIKYSSTDRLSHYNSLTLVITEALMKPSIRLPPSAPKRATVKHEVLHFCLLYYSLVYV